MLTQDVVIILESVETLTIHGSVYYQIQFHIEGSSTVQSARINPEAFYTNPEPGDKVAVQMILGQFMQAKKLN